MESAIHILWMILAGQPVELGSFKTLELCDLRKTSLITEIEIGRGNSLFCSSFVTTSGEAKTLVHTYRTQGSTGQNLYAGVNSGNQKFTSSVESETDGSYNSAFGRNTLSVITSGNSNTAMGHNALQAVTSGYNNTAMGRRALGSNTTGRNNTSVGTSAMYKNSTGTHNSAFGLQSLYSNTTGSHNASFGRDANFSNTTGNWNTGIGVDAIPGVTTGSGNTAVGGESGYTEDLRNQNVTGSHNVWLGYQSGPSSTKQLSNSIGIGYRAKNDKSDQVVIGNDATRETILNGKVTVTELCIDDQCLDSRELRNMLENAN